MSDAPRSVAWTMDTLLRGLADAERDWPLLVPRGEPFHPLLAMGGVELRTVPTASRGVRLAKENDGCAVVFVPNRQVRAAIHAADFGAPALLVLEDSPGVAPGSPPRAVAADAGLFVIEPTSPADIRHCTSAAVRLAETMQRSVAIVLHHWLLAAGATEQVTAPRPPRPAVEGWDALRLARRLELNRQRGIPSPGERVSVGFVTVGPADPALRYLASELRLVGRVATHNLRLVHPLDEAPLRRLLLRCRNLVVLEPRPGEVLRRITALAEEMRREGDEPATTWGGVLPPPPGSEQPVAAVPDALHPSVVARLIKHLLHELRPTAQIAEQLAPPPPDLPRDLGPRRRSIGTAAALRWLASEATKAARDVGAGAITIDGEHVLEGGERRVIIETWGPDRFRTDGIDAVADAAASDETRVLLVWGGGGRAMDMAHVARSAMPNPSDDQDALVEVTIDDVDRMGEVLRAATTRSGATVIITSEGNEPRFDLDALASAAMEIDQRGYRRQQAIVMPVEQMCAVRIQEADRWAPSRSQMPMPIESGLSINTRGGAHRWMQVSLRPILERVEVTRNHPPVRVVGHGRREGLVTPSPVHAEGPIWRAHVAGLRGRLPGAVASVLLAAGRRMGYDVRFQGNMAMAGGGRRAWLQVLYTRPRSVADELPIAASIPWGEADLLLAWDPLEAMHAISPHGRLQVASAQRTRIVANTGLLQDHTEEESTWDDQEELATALANACNTDMGMIGDFARLASWRFHNERLGDLVQLGVAFQRGLVPLTTDAISAAVREIEEDGFARSTEAFAFGRRLAMDSSAARVPALEGEVEDLDRMIRRSVRSTRTRRPEESRTLGRLAHRCRDSMPGLMETEDGRQTLRDAVVGIRRCLLWGGIETAQQYADILCALYAADRGERGRPMTRTAALPLADVMLIRDPIYLARLSRSPEVIRRVRRRLDVRQARGDEVERRFLARFRLSVGRLLLRVDIRTSDWSAGVVAWLGRWIPRHWRGHRRDRAVRAMIIAAMRQAARARPGEEAAWESRFAALHALSVAGALHRTSEADIRAILSQS